MSAAGIITGAENLDCDCRVHNRMLWAISCWIYECVLRSIQRLERSHRDARRWLWGQTSLHFTDCWYLGGTTDVEFSVSLPRSRPIDIECLSPRFPPFPPPPPPRGLRTVPASGRSLSIELICIKFTPSATRARGASCGTMPRRHDDRCRRTSGDNG